MNAHESTREGQGAPAPAGVASVPTVDAAAVLARHRAESWVGDGRLVCCWCETEWRGDAEAGGCDAARLAREVVALRGRAARAEAEMDGCRAALRDTLALVDERDALLDARVLERVAATERAARLEGLVRRLGGPFCPLCRRETPGGHAPACEVLAALLEGAESRGATQGFALPPRVADARADGDTGWELVGYDTSFTRVEGPGG